MVVRAPTSLESRSLIKLFIKSVSSTTFVICVLETRAQDHDRLTLEKSLHISIFHVQILIN